MNKSHMDIMKNVGDPDLENISELEDREIDGEHEFVTNTTYAGILHHQPSSDSRQVGQHPLSSHLTSTGQLTSTPATKKVQVKRTNYNSYRVIRDEGNIVGDDGDKNIPFSAISTNEYKVFVTNISPSANLNAIKNHICTKLKARVSLKLLSHPESAVLSFGLHCSSESTELDLNMPGLWPRGTRIYKWKSSMQNRRSSNQSRNNNLQRNGQHQGHQGSSASYVTHHHHHRRADQIHLKQQWEDKSKL